MPSDRWLKKVDPPKNVSQSDVRRMQQEKQARLAAVPDPPEELANQLTTVVNQLTSLPVPQPQEKFYPSRTRRKLKGIRLPVDKLERYEDWQHANRKLFPDFQAAVEYAMDWLTSQPVNQLTSQPVNQLTTLI